jgi:serine/threonine-protein kinase
MGTPAYMSPEQARDSKSVDVRTDVYSFAATVFASVAGHPPFESDSVAGVLLKVQTDAPAPLQSLVPSAPAGLQAVLERCMAKSPAARPASIDEAWREIQAALRGLPPSAHGGVAETLAPDAATIAPASYVAPAVTPAVAASTTLGGAAAQSTGGHDRRARWPWIMIPVVALATLGVLIAVNYDRKPASDAPPKADAIATVAGADPVPPDAEAVVAPPPVPDAAIAAAPDAAAAIEKPLAIENPARPRTDKPGRPAKPKTTPKVEPPKVEPPKPEPPKVEPPKLECSIPSFARIYEQTKPPEDDVRAAIGRLKRCKSQLAPDKYEQVLQNLVSKL